MECPRCKSQTRTLGVQYVQGAPFYEETCERCRVIYVGDRLNPQARTVEEILAESNQASRARTDRPSGTDVEKESKRLQREIDRLQAQIARLEAAKDCKPLPKATQEEGPEEAEKRARRTARAAANAKLGDLGGHKAEELAKLILAGSPELDMLQAPREPRPKVVVRPANVGTSSARVTGPLR